MIQTPFGSLNLSTTTNYDILSRTELGSGNDNSGLDQDTDNPPTKLLATDPCSFRPAGLNYSHECSQIPFSKESTTDSFGNITQIDVSTSVLGYNETYNKTMADPGDEGTDGSILDRILYGIQSISLSDLLGSISAVAMIFGGVIPYIPQYCEIRRTKNSDGFSLHVCLALLIANILRILFWFGKRYEIPLLVQSVVMIITMLLMVRLCVTVRQSTMILRVRERVFTATSENEEGKNLDWRFFWAWTDFQSYVDCVVLIAVCGAIITFMLRGVPIFVELLGLSAVLTEALLGVPQLRRNMRNKSTEGMSVTMVLLWTAGDIFKTVYFVLREAPMQFWLCGTLQVMVDVTILLQAEDMELVDTRAKPRKIIVIVDLPSP